MGDSTCKVSPDNSKGGVSAPVADLGFYKGTLIKRAGVRTLWTPPGSATGRLFAKLLRTRFFRVFYTAEAIGVQRLRVFLHACHEKFTRLPSRP